MSSSGAAPSVTTLNVGEAAMAKQKAPRISTDTTNAYLNITPGHLIVPVALMSSSRVLVASTYDPAGTAGTLTPNPWMGRLTVSADRLLDGTSTGPPGSSRRRRATRRSTP